ncbi:MAG: acyl carrier protein [Alphaproteobacteria bacterium]|nr:acyl carrier protein [Alphaproteobacteria bacterium SS10]
MATVDISALRDVFQKTLGVDPELVTEAAGPDDIPGWDSLGHMTLMTALEQHFGISLSIDDIMEMDTIAAILTVLKRNAEG